MSLTNVADLWYFDLETCSQHEHGEEAAVSIKKAIETLDTIEENRIGRVKDLIRKTSDRIADKGFQLGRCQSRVKVEDAALTFSLSYPEGCNLVVVWDDNSPSEAPAYHLAYGRGGVKLKKVIVPEMPANLIEHAIGALEALAKNLAERGREIAERNAAWEKRLTSLEDEHDSRSGENLDKRPEE